MILITFNVNVTSSEDIERLERITKICNGIGQMVQPSVFECLLEPTMLENIKTILEKTINSKTDTVRFYYLGNRWRKRKEHIGKNVMYDPEGPLIV